METPSGTKPTILIAEDEPVLLEVIAFEFASKGFNTLTAQSGNEARSLLDKSPVDLVLSDIIMPDGDGIELLRGIKADYPQIPVVLMTGYSHVPFEQLKKMGAADLLEKPFEFDELSRVVTCLLAEKERETA